MSIDNDRFLLKLEQARREINRATINLEIRTLTLVELEPIIQMVAKARAAYVKELFDLAATRSGLPTEAQINKLRTLRKAFEETVNACPFQISIYLDSIELFLGRCLCSAYE